MANVDDVRKDTQDAAEDVIANLAKTLDELRKEVGKLNKRDRGGVPRPLLLVALVAIVGAIVAVMNGRNDDDTESDDWS